MSTGFHHNDQPPQVWLDELHSFNIPYVWDIQLDKTRRSNLITRAQAQLKQWRLNLREQVKTIESRYDTSNQLTMERMREPYRLLETLGKDLDQQMSVLEKTIESGRAIPKGVTFGTVIFGDLKSKRWQLGEHDDERRWRDFLRVERRYQSLMQEYRQQKRGYDNTKQRYEEYQQEVTQTTARYQRERGTVLIGFRVAIVLALVVLCLIFGAVALLGGTALDAPLSNESIGAIMLILAVVGAIMAFVLARRRRQTIADLQVEIVRMQSTLQALKHDAQEQRRLILPTRQTLKEVRADYQALKATF
ncbi:MAG: hypothetical protein ACFE0Q_08645 [Anaerolineae bacterium]